MQALRFHAGPAARRHIEQHGLRPQDVGVIPPGHDAWVIGNEPVVMFDLTGTSATYAVKA